MQLVDEYAARDGVLAACAAVGLPRANYYRWKQPKPAPRPRPAPPRALAPEERERVLEVLHAPEYVDLAPAQVYAKLLDERGEYLCSERTMYRLLAASGEVRERRNQLVHPEYKKPELLATGPNQVWSWDITKLLGPAKWTHFYLYVILDIFSRYVVGWMIAERENAAHARRLLAETYTKHGVEPGALVLHQDRGAPMRAKSFAQLLADLGVTKSHSRPHVSDDNPFSEAQFKDAQVPARLPGAVRLGGRRRGVPPRVLRLVQPRAPARWLAAADAGRRALRPSASGARCPAAYPGCRLPGARQPTRAPAMGHPGPIRLRRRAARAVLFPRLRPAGSTAQCEIAR